MRTYTLEEIKEYAESNVVHKENRNGVEEWKDVYGITLRTMNGVAESFFRTDSNPKDPDQPFVHVWLCGIVVPNFRQYRVFSGGMEIYNMYEQISDFNQYSSLGYVDKTPPRRKVFRDDLHKHQ